VSCWSGGAKSYIHLRGIGGQSRKKEGGKAESLRLSYSSKNLKRRGGLFIHKRRGGSLLRKGSGQRLQAVRLDRRDNRGGGDLETRVSQPEKSRRGGLKGFSLCR